MNMCPQTDVRQDGGGTLGRGGRSQPVQDLSHLWSERLDDLLPRQKIIHEEVRDLVRQGQSLFLGGVSATAEDEATATKGD